MKIYFPIHLDGGNRGCEGIAKGSAILLGKQREELVGYCRNIELDTRLGVSEYVSLWKIPCSVFFVRRVIRKLVSILDKSKLNEVNLKCVYYDFIKKISKNDIMISTGGDMMCYEAEDSVYTNNLAINRGAKTILWGCSIGKNNLTPAKIDTLKKFSLIYARETLTAEMLREEQGLTNVVVFPDPAFVLTAERVELPEFFKHEDVVGLNISNYILGDFSLNSQIAKDIINYIEQLISTTNKHILLIPHVLWNEQDDRVVSQALYNKFKTTGRIHVLNTESLNYCQIRFVISKCSLFIGARTHAVISAYSTCVPTVALGYSIKSRGIAKDLSMPYETVVDSKNYSKGDFLKAIAFVEKNSTSLKHTLEEKMPEYTKSTFGIRGVMKEYGLINY